MTTPYTPVRIILADDHEIFRDGFLTLVKTQPWMTLVGEAQNGKVLVNMTRQLSPDIVLTDIKMPEMDGISAARVISRDFPNVGIIALTMFNDDNLIIDMIEAGAKGFLVKNAQKKEVIDAIVAVSNNQKYYCFEIAAKLVQLISKNRYDPERTFQKLNLNDREKEIICLICQENSNIEIAARLSLSVRTIEGIRWRLYEKLKIKTTTGLIKFAILHNIYVL